jgi:hypothetical protein
MPERHCKSFLRLAMSLFAQEGRKNRAISRADEATLPNGTRGTMPGSVSKRHIIQSALDAAR